MNTFRTELLPGIGQLSLTHHDGIMMMGSCFTENIGRMLKRYQMDVEINSHGILFNPISIANALNDVLSQRKFSSSELVLESGLFHSLRHHGSFSAHDANLAITQMNDSIEVAHSKLKKAKVLLLTFGSAWVYQHNKSKEIVANCHKIPQSEFTKELLSSSAIEMCLREIILQIQKFNPNIHVIFTISPVRHLRDGFFENQVSKSTLFLSILNLIQSLDHCHYFPAYELVMDDLRDYRFYHEDMIHPNSVAIQYVWEKFSKWCFDPSTLELMSKMEPILRFLEHRPMKISEAKHEEIRSKKREELSILIQNYS